MSLVELALEVRSHESAATVVNVRRLVPRGFR
jgi:hypothetical protein